MKRPKSDLPSEILGEVTLPSGFILIVDTGLLKFWCHDRSPQMPEGAASDNIVASANAATDFRLEGPDAERAGRAFDRQWHPRFLYDIPPHGIEQVHASFAACVREYGLDARLMPLDGRVPHRQRADDALAHGGGAGEVMFQGISAVAIRGVPADRPLAVLGRRMPPEDSYADRWRCVWLECLPGSEVARSELAGTVAVDEARLMFADLDALGKWQHEEALDGQADFVFWGRDAEQAAYTVGAPALGNGQWGWEDLPVQETIRQAIAIEELCEKQDYKFATDFRPHSHHYLVMKQVRTTPTASGTLEVGGAKVCTFMTSWGMASFPCTAIGITRIGWCDSASTWATSRS